MKYSVTLFILFVFTTSLVLGQTCADISNNLSVGVKNTEVTSLQQYLAEKEYLKVSPTGYFGSQTKQAVQSFQSISSITPTGFVGPLTRAELKRVSCVSTVVLTNTPTTATPPQVVSSWNPKAAIPFTDTTLKALKNILESIGFGVTSFATTTMTESEILEMTRKFEQDYIFNK